MEHSYKNKLIESLGVLLSGSGIGYSKYYHIDTIKLTLPKTIDLEQFGNNFFQLLASLPEIEHPAEMVYFWLAKVDTADFKKILINPTPEAARNWEMVGIGPESWLHISELKAYQEKLKLICRLSN